MSVCTCLLQSVYVHVYIPLPVAIAMLQHTVLLHVARNVWKYLSASGRRGHLAIWPCLPELQSMNCHAVNVHASLWSIGCCCELCDILDVTELDSIMATLSCIPVWWGAVQTIVRCKEVLLEATHFWQNWQRFDGIACAGLRCKLEQVLDGCWLLS